MSMEFGPRCTDVKTLSGTFRTTNGFQWYMTSALSCFSSLFFSSTVALLVSGLRLFWSLCPFLNQCFRWMKSRSAFSLAVLYKSAKRRQFRFFFLNSKQNIISVIIMIIVLRHWFKVVFHQLFTETGLWATQASREVGVKSLLSIESVINEMCLSFRPFERHHIDPVPTCFFNLQCIIWSQVEHYQRVAVPTDIHLSHHSALFPFCKC